MTRKSDAIFWRPRAAREEKNDDSDDLVAVPFDVERRGGGIRRIRRRRSRRRSCRPARNVRPSRRRASSISRRGRAPVDGIRVGGAGGIRATPRGRSRWRRSPRAFVFLARDGSRPNRRRSSSPLRVGDRPRRVGEEFPRASSSTAVPSESSAVPSSSDVPFEPSATSFEASTVFAFPTTTRASTRRRVRERPALAPGSSIAASPPWRVEASRPAVRRTSAAAAALDAVSELGSIFDPNFDRTRRDASNVIVSA